MASPLVTKIVLRSKTKMSLNERFTAYRAAQAQDATTFRNRVQVQRQVSSANLRLAQQMANRPSVVAALRLKKRSMQQRLGRRPQTPSSNNIKSRLNFNGRRRFYMQGRLGGFRGRGGGGGMRQGGYRQGTSPLIKARLGPPRFTQQNQQRTNFRGNRRGNNRGNFRGGRQQQSRGISQPVIRNNRGQGQRGGRGRGRGGRWSNNLVPAVPTKQELDNQLDEYMAETKPTFDISMMS